MPLLPVPGVNPKTATAAPSSGLPGYPARVKSTLAHAVEEALHQRGCRPFVLDGDNVRHGLCGDLGFSPLERVENIRRVGEIRVNWGLTPLLPSSSSGLSKPLPYYFSFLQES